MDPSGRHGDEAPTGAKRRRRVPLAVMMVRLIGPVAAVIFTIWMVQEARDELHRHGGATSFTYPDPHRTTDPHTWGGPATMTTPEPADGNDM